MTSFSMLRSMALSAVVLAMSAISCGQGLIAAEREPGGGTSALKRTARMKIKIDSKTFDATLFDGPTAEAFKAMLPLTLRMDDLNGNEKKYDFATRLPVDAANPTIINSGDLMIWGSRTLVLFYRSFRTPYSYTKLGKIDHPAELDAAVGKGSIEVRFELEGNAR
jgi:hypothetical protein